ncbi:MAG TPA: prepilin-type N-terminal cleavage/methylation domain-containing protein, partial [Candidatus Paceibacterota bacterium]|nr:prepilin-type N-terminal cleavage/methylation domain-containing protein [Candidatus Paceibacterota bacterium]
MKIFKVRKKGFTLIELMVVIAIIGILASIIMVSLSSAQSKGRDAKRVADIRTIQLALEEYYNDNGNYP